MVSITYSKKNIMIYIREIKGISKYGNNYHYIQLLKAQYTDQVNKILGKCFDCIPNSMINLNLECGDIVEVIFDKHSNRKNPQIYEIEPTGENIFKMLNHDELINQKNTVIYNNSTHNGNNNF